VHPNEIHHSSPSFGHEIATNHRVCMYSVITAQRTKQIVEDQEHYVSETLRPTSERRKCEVLQPETLGTGYHHSEVQMSM